MEAALRPALSVMMSFDALADFAGLDAFMMGWVSSLGRSSDAESDELRFFLSAADETKWGPRVFHCRRDLGEIHAQRKQKTILRAPADGSGTSALTLLRRLEDSGRRMKWTGGFTQAMSEIPRRPASRCLAEMCHFLAQGTNSPQSENCG